MLDLHRFSPAALGAVHLAGMNRMRTDLTAPAARAWGWLSLKCYEEILRRQGRQVAPCLQNHEPPVMTRAELEATVEEFARPVIVGAFRRSAEDVDPDEAALREEAERILVAAQQTLNPAAAAHWN